MIAEELGMIVNRAVAVAIQDEQAVIRQHPGCGFAEVVQVDVPIDGSGLAERTNLHSVAIEIEDKRRRLVARLVKHRVQMVEDPVDNFEEGGNDGQPERAQGFSSFGDPDERELVSLFAVIDQHLKRGLAGDFIPGHRPTSASSSA